MKTKAKLITTTIRTREELETAVGEYAKCEYRKTALKAEMEVRIAAIRAEYEEPKALLDVAAEQIHDDIYNYAQLNPAEFGDKKSIDLLHGTIGFRIGNPKVAWPKGTTDSAAVEFLEKQGLDLFIRVKEEPDKERILAEFANENTMFDQPNLAKLRGAGISVKQDERFFITVKEEEVA